MGYISLGMHMAASSQGGFIQPFNEYKIRLACS